MIAKSEEGRVSLYRLRHLWLPAIVLALSCCLQAQCSDHANLDDMERASFVAAAEGSRSEIYVQLLTARGCAPAVLDELHAMGLTERLADSNVGFVWLTVPKEKVLEVPDLAGISEAFAATDDIDYTFPDAPEEGPAKPLPIPPITLPIEQVVRELPAGGPYFPAQEAGLSELWKQHPDADGRGVRVALSDDGIDLLHPALREALDAHGREVPKVADIFDISNPAEASGWVQFGPPIAVNDGKFHAGGRDWIAPHDGLFRFGMYHMELFLSAWIPGVSSGKPPADVKLSVGVLWDENSNRVWVDTNGDGSFLDQNALGDYGKTHDIDWFGSKTVDGDNRLPFGVKIDRRTNAAYISLGRGDHGSAVAGSLAANRITGGLYDGAAPNAQLVDVRGESHQAIMPLLTMALARNDVDLLNRSGAFLDFAPGGRIEKEFDRHVVDRVTATYDKPISCLCFSTRALSVFDYQSPEMLRRNRGLKTAYLDAANGGAQPDADGLVNTILAPSAMLATQSRYNPLFAEGKNGEAVSTFGADGPPGSPAPAGYWIGSNPSPTIPFGAGVLADLISEARSTGIRYNAQRLVDAVLLSGRLVPRLPMTIQGHGVIDAAAAWQQLEGMAGSDDPAITELTSFTIEEGEGHTRRQVQGFQSNFPRESSAQTVPLWITRHGGYPAGRSYLLTLRGNDGAFTLITRRVNLAREKAAVVAFSFKPLPGRHLAFLRLIDAATHIAMHEIPLSVRSNVGKPAAPGIDQYRATIPALNADYESVHLDPKVQAARFEMRIPNAGRARYSNRFLPGYSYNEEGPITPGGHFVETKVPVVAPVDAAHNVGPMQKFESLIRNPGVGLWGYSEPNVYEMGWSNGGGIEYATPYDEPVPDVPIRGTVTISKYAVHFKRQGKRLIATNELADVTGRVEFYRADLHHARLAGIGNHAGATLERELPPYLSQWRVHVSVTHLPESGTDAYLFNCSGKNGCKLVDQQSIGRSGATLTADEPEAGSWRVVVRARHKVASAASYDFRDALLSSDADDSETIDSTHLHNARWHVALSGAGDSSYVAFSIAGTPGVANEKHGVRIAMTSLVPGAP